MMKEGESEEALRLAKLRQRGILELIHSRNQLARFTPSLLIYSTSIFIVGSLLLYSRMCQPAFLMRLLLPNKACYSRTRPVTLESNAYDDFHFLITGGYASTFVFAILEILDSKKKGMLWNSRLYCFAAISFVGLFTSLIITLHWIPPVNSVFDHPVEAPRLIQWLTTTPLLTFMMYSLDVRSNSDVMLLWFSVCLQQFSVLCGIVANFTTNYTIGVIFMVFAAGSVVWIIAGAFLAFRRIGAVVEEAQRNELIASASATTRESGNKPTKHVLLKELKPEKISSILASEENLGVIISFQITLYSAFFWALTAAVFFSGLFRVLSPELESALQSLVDLLMKCFYAQALCSSHGYVLSPEGILMKLLLLEEKAHATFRQSMRFVFHELSSPLNTISLGINTLSPSELTADGVSLLEQTRENCKLLITSLKDIRELSETTKLELRLAPFNFKALVRETARVHAAAASEAKVTLLLALDSLIPECVVGDSVRLKSIMSCFIMNGINQASGGHCTIIATPVAAPLKPPGAEEVNVRDEVERVGIRFEVKDDGDGLEDGVGGDIANWGGSSKMSAISLGLFRRIIEAHGGIIGIESQKGRGCSVFFSVFFPLPDKMEPVIEVLNPQRAASRRGSSIDRSSFSSSSLQHIHIHHPEVPKSNIRITTQSSLPQALVADDLLSSRRMVGRVLERMGFDVEYAEDGVFAVELCIGRLQDTEGKEQDGEKERSSSYAIVIMDNAMPNLSGIEAVKKIRQCGYTGPIVGLTGDFSDEAIETFEECGCDAVITKPLDVPELKRTLLSLGVKIPHKNFNH